MADRLCPPQSKGAKEKVVTRILVSRCEVDLMKIRAEFRKLHQRSLFQTISVSRGGGDRYRPGPLTPDRKYTFISHFLFMVSLFILNASSSGCSEVLNIHQISLPTDPPAGGGDPLSQWVSS